MAVTGYLASCAGPVSHEPGFGPSLPYAGRTPFTAPPPQPPPPSGPKPARASLHTFKSQDIPAAPAEMVTVQPGDTVFAISRRTGTEPRQIIDANNLAPPYRLTPGTKLTILHPPIHVVGPGETSYAISREYGVDLTSLMRLNGIRPPYDLYVGQRLALPPRDEGASTTGGPAKASLPPPPPPLDGGGFLWPLRGRVISAFGAKPGGLHNDGINIAARRGEPVRAAESGVVAYAGDDLKGYGNLLLIRHQGGWVTAYAHNERLLVRRGQKVRRGERIALAGMTGDVRRPQLHFEIRQGVTAVDPAHYLR